MSVTSDKQQAAKVVTPSLHVRPKVKSVQRTGVLLGRCFCHASIVLGSLVAIVCSSLVLLFSSLDARIVYDQKRDAAELINSAEHVA